MVEPITLKPEVSLQVERCWTCGCWWAAERRGESARCPRCAERTIEIERAEKQKLEHRVRSLKGALTRAKGRRRG